MMWLIDYSEGEKSRDGTTISLHFGSGRQHPLCHQYVGGSMTIIQATPGTVNLYDQALRDGERRRARAKLQSWLCAYYAAMDDTLSPDDINNLAIQASDVANELLAGYPNKKGND